MYIVHHNPASLAARSTNTYAMYVCMFTKQMNQYIQVTQQWEYVTANISVKFYIFANISKTVCRSSKIAQKLETRCLEIASPSKWVVIWKNSPKIAQCGDVSSEHPGPSWTKLHSYCASACLLRAHA